MAWTYLVFAGFFEMIGVTMINVLHKKRNVFSLIGLLLGFGMSFLFLSLAMKTLAMGTAYAVWTGIGATGATILGMVFYGEPVEKKRVFFIFLIIAATVGLKIYE
ncbi:DMT family transporter [Salirhabdus euzebyi]|nr:multidrug efflux SMR transporter [Salirhabdus euzebyi]